ncbi:AAA domain-containing protein [Crocinitomicaceae bacterium]|nr:AAA domain-containing protein [Crocinitomicaceae bacterium]
MTNIKKNSHQLLLQEEIRYKEIEWEFQLGTYAAKMLLDEDLFLAKYQGFDEKRGNILLKFDHSVCHPPRKNSIFTCFLSEFQDEKVKNWGGLTYEDLRTHCINKFEARTVFFKYEEGHTIVGFSGISEESVKKFKTNALVFLGPQDPPLLYLYNLKDFIDITNPSNNSYLDLSLENNNWSPKPFQMEDRVYEIQTALIERDTVIIQGPPGTGKTYLMSQICNALLKANFRILVTAMTNRALIELAEKEHLKEALKEGKVFKTSLTADEQKNKKIKGIRAFKRLKEQKPPLLLSTYYKMSQIATKAMEDEHFDYIIIEEASQAFLSTIAITRKLGKKVIIVGDICQLEPIFHKEFSEEDPNNYGAMVCGLRSLSYYYKNSKNFILTDSHRLTKKSVYATNAFYNDQLKSISDSVLPLGFKENTNAARLLNSFGGPSVKRIDLDDGYNPSVYSIKLISDLITELIEIGLKEGVAVLAFNVTTVKKLQSQIGKKFQNHPDIYIETVDRIQGMTVDHCIYVITKESIPFAINPNRFNVATSRAKLCTLIIADSNIDHFLKYEPLVEDYFLRLKLV